MTMSGDAQAGSSRDANDGNEASRVVLVDDLAAADDYWLTITDAARVTRRQEITIRRWIAAGDLPVRRQRMGLNKRTRHVRASDLAQLTPIIDPTATITGAPANADLLSIPVQQAQLLTAQHVLTQRLTQCEQALATLTAQRDADRQLLEQQEMRLRAASDSVDAVRRDLQAEVLALRQKGQEGTTELTALITAQVQRLERALDAQEETAARALHDTADQLAQERAARERGHEELAAALMTHLAAVRQLEQVTQQVQTQQAEQQAHIEQERRDWQQHFAKIAGQQEQTQQRLEEAVNQLREQQVMTTALSEHLTVLQHEQQEWQRQMSTVQDRYAALHADLHGQLQAEQQRRRVLEQQVQFRAFRAWRRRRVLHGQSLAHAEGAVETH